MKKTILTSSLVALTILLVANNCEARRWGGHDTSGAWTRGRAAYNQTRDVTVATVQDIITGRTQTGIVTNAVVDDDTGTTIANVQDPVTGENTVGVVINADTVSIPVPTADYSRYWRP